MVLSPDPKSKTSQDGFLTFDEVANLNTNSKLVNLAACNTARELYDIDGVDGFVQAFLMSGSESVISTLWSIEDKSTRIFMNEFYTKVNNTHEFGKSLSEVKRDFIKNTSNLDYSHPFYWSPYIFFIKNNFLFLQILL